MIINYDVNNKGGGGASAEGCVRYDQQQELTDEQQAQAKENLGIEDPEPQAAVLYTPQTLTTAQQQQARQNIGMEGTFSYTVRYVDDSTGEQLVPNKIISGINYGAAITEHACSIDGYQVKRESITKTIVADTIFEFAYIAEGGSSQVQADWNETDSTDPAFIKNKPTINQPENHQIVRNALASTLTIDPNEWAELCRIEIPEDGAYQVSALVKPTKVATAESVTINVTLRQKRNSDVTELAEIELQPNHVTGCMARAINALRGDILVIESYSINQYGIQAQPSVGKARATYLEAVRIGAIYPE